MTNKEAIDILINSIQLPATRNNGKSQARLLIIEAIQKAVVALEDTDVVRCKDCKYCDSFPNKSDATMPLKCLNIRYGGVCPDWFCEHGERKNDNS